jgi:hypothetical protein
MIKLVDYFVVVGFDESTQLGNGSAATAHYDENDDSNPISSTNQGRGRIIQRFPAASSSNIDNTNETNEKEINDINDVTESTSWKQHQQQMNNDDPEQDFDNNIHCFCQPHKGWRLHDKQEVPTFFVSVLTDMKGHRRYCACLTFLEPYIPPNQTNKRKKKDKSSSHNETVLNNNNNKLNNNSEKAPNYAEYINNNNDNDQKIKNNEETNHLNSSLPIQPSHLYVAKSLVLISRLEYIDLFKSLLTLIYAVYVDRRESISYNSNNLFDNVAENLLGLVNNVNDSMSLPINGVDSVLYKKNYKIDDGSFLLEKIIANMLSIRVHAPGTASISSFSLGADDRHTVQATASLTVPSTGSAVYRLFNDIGIVNVLKLVCAIVADFKILFFSR